MSLTEEQNNCPYCHKKNKALTRSLINTSSLSLLIEGNILDAAYCQTLTDNYKDGWAYIPINYCPMCGRPLNEKEE